MTSRGFAVVDVDYGGSTGYGRAYRKRLDGRVGRRRRRRLRRGAPGSSPTRGDVDRERLAIAGGSAGGYTTLCALAFRDVFAAGVSYFGVGDLEAFARDTHKFESRYLDRLVGPYPEAAGRCTASARRSTTSTGSRCPVLVLQGLEDKVVPPDQAERDRRRRSRRTASRTPTSRSRARTTGSGGGEHRSASLEAELSFYGAGLRLHAGRRARADPLEGLAARREPHGVAARSLTA